MAIGPDTQALGGQSTSIGNNTRAKGNSSVAIGGDDWDIAKTNVGADYQRLTGSTMSSGYQGTETAEAAVAVGVKAMATGALAQPLVRGHTPHKWVQQLIKKKPWLSAQVRARALMQPQ